MVWGSSLLCPIPTLIGRQEFGGASQNPPTPTTTSSRRLKGPGLPHSCLSHHQCRSSFLFTGMGAHCYGDSRRCPLQVADIRPSPSLGLPIITAAASPATGLAKPSGLRSKEPWAGTAQGPGQGSPYLSQAPGTSQTQDTRSPVGQKGQARGCGNRHFLGGGGGTWNSPGKRPETEDRQEGSSYGSLSPLAPHPAWAPASCVTWGTALHFSEPRSPGPPGGNQRWL